MAITIDGGAGSGHFGITDGSFVTSISTSVTVAATANPFVLVGVAIRGDPGSKVTSVTLGPYTLQSVTGNIAVVATGGNQCVATSWATFDNAAGTATSIAAGTYTLTVTVDIATKIDAGFSTFYGVDQTTPLRQQAPSNPKWATIQRVTTFVTTTPVTLTLPNTAVNDWIWDSFNASAFNFTVAVSGGTNRVQRWNFNAGGNSTTSITAAGSTEDATAGTTAISWSRPTGAQWMYAWIAVSLVPGAGTVAVTKQGTLNLEAVGPLSLSSIFNLEAITPLSLSSVLNMEALKTPASFTGMHNMEALKHLSPTATENVEATKTLSLTATKNLEAVKIVPGRYRTAVQIGAPLAYWRFEETSGTTAGDSGATGTATGTYANGPSLGQPPIVSDGGFSVGFNLSATTNQQMNNTTAALRLTGAVTIEAWIYPTDITTPVASMIITQGEGTAVQYSLFVTPAGALAFQWNDGAFNSLTSPSGLIATNQRYYVVATRTAGQTITLYINGRSVALGSGTVPTGSPLQLDIGGTNDATHYFKGYIDEVAIYNTPLAAINVATHYLAGSQLHNLEATDGLTRSQTANLEALKGLSVTGTHQMEVVGALSHVVQTANLNLEVIGRLSQQSTINLEALLALPSVQRSANVEAIKALTGTGTLNVEAIKILASIQRTLNMEATKALTLTGAENLEVIGRTVSSRSFNVEAVKRFSQTGTINVEVTGGAAGTTVWFDPGCNYEDLDTSQFVGVTYYFIAWIATSAGGFAASARLQVTTDMTGATGWTTVTNGTIQQTGQPLTFTNPDSSTTRHGIWTKSAPLTGLPVGPALYRVQFGGSSGGNATMTFSGAKILVAES